MSNDQSPPVRKVIPYKKSRHRQSPFSEMAFHFSGTALDVAIQQREQDDIGSSQEEASDTEEADVRSALSDTPATEVRPPQPAGLSPANIPQVLADAEEQQHSQQTIASASKIKEKKATQNNARLLTHEKDKSTVRAETQPAWQMFVTRWKPFLTETQLSICTYIYNNSVAINQEFCFTSTAKMMENVSKTERQVKTVLNQLMDLDFLIKGETIVNAPREKRGTYYKLNPQK